MAIDSSRELAALTPHVQGNTLSFGLEPTAPQAGTPTRWDPPEQGRPGPRLRSVETASVDAVVALQELERATDPLACLAEWRRVLRQGGRLAVVQRSARADSDVVRHTFTPGYLVALLNRLGGFNVAAIEDIEPGSSWILVAERNHVAEIRSPLGTIGAELAGCAREHQDARAELYFQIGTVFLQAGDPVQAEASFKRMLEIEAENDHGLFGLAMSHGGQGRWSEARDELQRVVDRDPSNADANRWLALAVERAKPATSSSQRVSPASAGSQRVSPAAPRAGHLRV